MNLSKFAPFLAFCLLTAPLPADVTYVDATMANTNNAAGGADSTWLDGNDGSTGGNDVEIHIDDLPALGWVGAGVGGGAGSEAAVRTWYDGVGYKLVPELSEFLLTITPATAPATGFQLAWQSQAGKLYNLRTSADLTGPISTWSLVEGDIDATPPTNTYPVDPADPRRFYAVEEQVEP